MQTTDGLSLRAIEVFIAVIEAGSMSAAAERLKASASGVSQQVANLEQALGTKLLDRQARPIALTPAGLLFRRRAQKILDEIGTARAELMELRAAALPRLRLAIIDDLDVTLTPPLVERISARYPSCIMEARSGRSDHHMAALLDRRVDVIVTGDWDDKLDRLERHILLREPFVLATAKGLLTPGEDPIPQLMGAPFVRFLNHIPLGRQIERHLRRIRFSPPHHLELDSAHSILAMVCANSGWAIIPPLAYLDVVRFQDQIEVSPLPFPSFFRTVSLTAREGELGELPARLAGLCRELIEERCVATARTAMPWLGESMRVERPENAPADEGALLTSAE